jgi:hypothetical protein
VYYLWQIYGAGKLQKAVHIGLTLSLFLLLPVNAVYGDLWVGWLHGNTDRLQGDMQAGLSAQEVAARNKEILWALDEKDFIKNLELLRSARVAPFSKIGVARQDSPAPAADTRSAPVPSFMTTSVFYHAAGATEAYLHWGVNGWRMIPNQYWPKDTTVVSSNMRTPLRGQKGLFQVDLRVPADARLNLGFLISKCGSNRIEPVYEELPETPVNVTRVDFQSKLECRSDGSVVLTRRDMISKEIRYRNDEAGEVSIIWGVDGWHLIAPDLRPEHTSIRSNAMQTPMTFVNGWFTATLKAPIGSTIDYGFSIPLKRGVIHLTGSPWEPGASALMVKDSQPVLIQSTRPIRNQLTRLVPLAKKIAVLLVALMAVWSLLYLSIRAISV